MSDKIGTQEVTMRSITDNGLLEGGHDYQRGPGVDH